MLLGLSRQVVLFKLLTALLQGLLVLHKLSMLRPDVCLLDQKPVLLYKQCIVLTLDFLPHSFQILSFIHLHGLLVVDRVLTRVWRRKLRRTMCLRTRIVGLSRLQEC